MKKVGSVESIIVALFEVEQSKIQKDQIQIIKTKKTLWKKSKKNYLRFNLN